MSATLAAALVASLRAWVVVNLKMCISWGSCGLFVSVSGERVGVFPFLFTLVTDYILLSASKIYVNIFACDVCAIAVWALLPAGVCELLVRVHCLAPVVGTIPAPAPCHGAGAGAVKLRRWG